MKSIALFFALSLTVFAQTKPAAPKPEPAATQPSPQLTELEKTKLENFNLKYALLQQQQTQLQAQYQALSQAIAAEHPGYRVDPQTFNLVAIPSPPKK